MNTKRIAASLLLAGALFVGFASPALATLITKTVHLLPGVETDALAKAIADNPERMFGFGTVSNRVVINAANQHVQEFDTSAFWAAGVDSAHVKMTVRNISTCSFFCSPQAPYEVVVELSSGAEGVVRHSFDPGFSFFLPAQWTNDYSALESDGGLLETELLREVHNLVVIPSVKALAAELAIR